MGDSNTSWNISCDFLFFYTLIYYNQNSINIYNQRSIETLLNNSIIIQHECPPSFKAEGKSTITVNIRGISILPQCGEINKPLLYRSRSSHDLIFI